jgi:hypothetical protein
MTDLCMNTMTKARVSWVIIILIFTQVIGNLCLVLYEAISAFKKRFYDNKKLAKAVSSDKYEIGEADSKQMTEIELKQMKSIGGGPSDEQPN